MSSKVDIIAHRYAKSLADLIGDNKKELDSVYESFKSFVALLDESSDLDKIFSSPVVTSEELLKVVRSVLDKSKSDVSEVFKGFLISCAKHKRMGVIRDIFKAFTKIKYDADNVSELLIESADEVSDQQIDKIKLIVAKYSDKKMVIRKKINKDLLGGFVLEFDSYRIDASIKTKLFNFRNVLKEVA